VPDLSAVFDDGGAGKDAREAVDVEKEI